MREIVEQVFGVFSQKSRKLFKSCVSQEVCTKPIGCFRTIIFANNFFDQIAAQDYNFSTYNLWVGDNNLFKFRISELQFDTTK